MEGEGSLIQAWDPSLGDQDRGVSPCFELEEMELLFRPSSASPG